jgi:hypothetical protein
VIVEKLVEWRLARETEVLRENLPGATLSTTNQHSRLLSFWTSYIIQYFNEHYSVSEPGYFSILRWGVGRHLHCWVCYEDLISITALTWRRKEICFPKHCVLYCCFEYRRTIEYKRRPYSTQGFCGDIFLSGVSTPVYFPIGSTVYAANGIRHIHIYHTWSYYHVCWEWWKLTGGIYG